MYIFDLDGTITDTNGIWQDVDLEFLARRGLTHTQEYQRVVERSIFPLAAQFTKEYYHLPESPQDIMSEWDAMAGLHYRELARLKPGAEDYLRQCRAEGRPMAVFTACRPAMCRAVLDRFQLTDLFGHIVFAEEIGLEKRDPQCFVALGRLLGVPLGDCVLFDDSPDNCATAQKAGMTAVGVYDGYYAGRQEELKAACSRYILSFQELVRK
ncbi:MAG: HAD family phosphatase [Oscillospiraceae bacterium]|jgi:HAD superfamily hydrolase (TIGR01509 family)|nr:HAD family phosphatase [Oscillospiraceae bacterium]